MKVKKLNILDINNHKVEITNKIAFIEHIRRYHASGISFHEENGQLIKIDDKLRKQIKKYE